jgi:hypothetical protein
MLNDAAQQLDAEPLAVFVVPGPGQFRAVELRPVAEQLLADEAIVDRKSIGCNPQSAPW